MLFGPMPWSAARSASVQRVRSPRERMPAPLKARSAGPDRPDGNAARFGCVASVDRAIALEAAWEVRCDGAPNILKLRRGWP